MRLANRINTLWSLAVARSADGARLRRRLAAAAGLATLLSGLLAAVGLLIVVLVLVVVVCAGVGCAAAIALLPARWPKLRSRCSGWIRRSMSRGHTLGAATVRLCGELLVRAHFGLRRARRLSAGAIAQIRLQAPELAATCSSVASRAAEELATASRSAAERTRPLTEAVRQKAVPPAAQPSHRQREALRLNTEGTKLRRSGSYAMAVELHDRALEILQELGDRRAAALTLNNLALAMSHAGRDVEAIELFEQAVEILRELGDGEHEGRVIANLGLAHRRHGRRQQSHNVLQLALTKLSPTSSAYRTVEAELRRAS